MNQKILQRLAWKDFRTVAPLGIALLLFTFVFNLVLYWGYAGSTGPSVGLRHWLVVGLWLLIPNLFALGAPAMLIGGEEESGSLAWLRTLPADWRWIAGSKLLSGFIGFALLFFVSTTGYIFQRAMFEDYVVEQLRTIGDFYDPLWLHVLGHFVFGVALFLVSSICSYTFRSPVSALVAVAPAMVGCSFGFMRLTDWLSQSGFGQDPWEELLSSHWIGVILVGATLCLFLLVVLLLCARRRLTGTTDQSIGSAAIETSVEAFRPPSQPKMIGLYDGDRLIRPRRYLVLLWQMLRQTGPFLFVGFVACIVGAFFEGIMAPLLVLPGLLLIGGITFYGDTVRHRASFFYDRGIATTPIWLSRVLPTLLVTVAAVLFHIYLSPYRPDPRGTMLVLALFAFGICQLTSLWSPRPILVFFAAPVAIALVFSSVTPLIDYLRFRSQWFLWLGLAMTLFASWRMMPSYLQNDRNRLFHLRYFAGVGLIVIVPYVLFIGNSLWRTPSIQTQWRQETLALDVTNPVSNPLEIDDGVVRREFGELYIILARARELPQGIDEVRQKELSAQGSVGKYVSFDELLVHCPFFQLQMTGIGYEGDFAGITDDVEREKQVNRRITMDLETVAIFAKWSRLIREASLTDDISYVQLNSTAEEADRISLLILREHVKAYGVTDELRQIYDSLPSIDLVARSRNVCMIRSWQKIQQNEPAYDPNESVFNGHLMSYGISTHYRMPAQWWLWTERRRLMLNFDAQVMWRQQRWDSGQSWGDVPITDEELRRQTLLLPCSDYYVRINDQQRKKLDAAVSQSRK